MTETIYEALGNYLRQPWRAPTVVYLGETQLKALYKQYGGVLLELFGCKVVAVEKNDYIAFGNRYEEIV